MAMMANVTPAPSGFRIPRWAKWLFFAGVGIFLFGAILLPNLCKASETANRVKCAANLHAIGDVLQLYAQEHEGKYPDKLSDLVASEGVTASVFICPSSSADTGTGKTPDEIVADLAKPEHCSYVYTKENLGKPDKVIVYERQEDHDKVGVNVLFGDFHVDFFQQRPKDHSTLSSLGVPESAFADPSN